MGCGWTMTDADLARVDAIEVVNGGAARLPGGVEGPLSGIEFWRRALARRGGVTAIGGSDNHDADQTRAVLSSIGRPTTVVRANGLTQAAILAGIRSGRVFIDIDGRERSMLDLTVVAGGIETAMGGALNVEAGEAIDARVTVDAPPGSRLDVLANEAVIASTPIKAAGNYKFTVDRRERPLTLRAVVRGADGAILLMSNAVVISAAARN